ncbi:GGDEF domain-containing protein [Novosphingobium gossypii]|uniref:GGDEF domain-containing protein n=1 Tax=Novosphingobium gossypii TaxID=1604774 RepID=UPI003D1FAB8B
MHVQSAPVDEAARLAALQRLAILDTPREAAFDNIVSLVRTVLHVPISAVTLVDRDRQWFKAIEGLDATETPRSESFCAHAIQRNAPLLIPDATQDDRVSDYPAVMQDPHVRAYAGVPLVTSDGYNVGALCAVDTKAREFTEGEVAILRDFARIVVNEMELRRIAERDQLTGALSRRGFIEKVNQEIARCHRYGRDASLVLIDVDHFKSVNDSWGHPAGDAVLRELAATLQEAGRSADVLGRWAARNSPCCCPKQACPKRSPPPNAFARRWRRGPSWWRLPAPSRSPPASELLPWIRASPWPKSGSPRRTSRFTRRSAAGATAAFWGKRFLPRCVKPRRSGHPYRTGATITVTRASPFPAICRKWRPTGRS